MSQRRCDSSKLLKEGKEMSQNEGLGEKAKLILDFFAKVEKAILSEKSKEKVDTLLELIKKELLSRLTLNSSTTMTVIEDSASDTTKRTIQSFETNENGRKSSNKKENYGGLNELKESSRPFQSTRLLHSPRQRSKSIREVANKNARPEFCTEVEKLVEEELSRIFREREKAKEEKEEDDARRSRSSYRKVRKFLDKKFIRRGMGGDSKKKINRSFNFPYKSGRSFQPTGDVFFPEVVGDLLKGRRDPSSTCVSRIGIFSSEESLGSPGKASEAKEQQAGDSSSQNHLLLDPKIKEKEKEVESRRESEKTAEERRRNVTTELGSQSIQPTTPEKNKGKSDSCFPIENDFFHWMSYIKSRLTPESTGDASDNGCSRSEDLLRDLENEPRATARAINFLLFYFEFLRGTGVVDLKSLADLLLGRGTSSSTSSSSTLSIQDPPTLLLFLLILPLSSLLKDEPTLRLLSSLLPTVLGLYVR